LVECLIGIANGKIAITTKNPYYWIVHYIFEDEDGIDATQVKKKIKEMYFNSKNDKSDNEESELAKSSEEEDSD